MCRQLHFHAFLFVKTKPMQNFTNFNNPFSTYRIETVNGREYLVANGVPIVEGILNKHLVSMDEFGAFVHDWNGIPLVVRHPKENNGSARVPKPDVSVVGNFYSAALDAANRRLVGEYWFDKLQLLSAGKEGKKIYDNILAGKMVETSTGYFANIEDEVGYLNGLPYIGVQHGIHPDHIAVLPDEVGACSIFDGCGINRNSAVLQNCEGCPMKTLSNVTGDLPAEARKIYEAAYKSAKEDGDDEETDANKAWGAVKRSGWTQGEDKKWSKNETDSEDEVKDNSQAPSQDNWLVRLFSNSNKKEKQQMDKFKELVQKILNEAGWSVKFEDSDKSASATPNAAPLSETLTGLESVINEAGGVQKFKELLTNLGKIPADIQALTDSISTISGSVKLATEMAQNAATKAESDKKNTVARLVANTNCPLDEATLNGMALDVLEKLETSYRPTNYAALGAFSVTQNADEKEADSILVQPSMLDAFSFEKEKVN